MREIFEAVLKIKEFNIIFSIITIGTFIWGFIEMVNNCDNIFKGDK